MILKNYKFLFNSQGLGVSFITLDEYPLNLVPFDNDLLSLEMDGAFKVQFYFNMFGWIGVFIA